ncbi:(2Fe-2S)-binding protein [Streptomyces sp. JB150]|uniref:(2Fe-2S)-binding protein n=1 Tax=Streptomyces sp. JB150 TaxID=2714844 RepID=UPI0014077B1F|nr:(2Fe-2S)-binding protein [Streptomyces sp. JB150]QIJ65697.1 (2Fe-2S)-binding protein [Streptomyces sp. JB150]
MSRGRGRRSERGDRTGPLRLARARPDAAFTFTFDGRTLPALSGQTVAAALWSSGVTSWRTTRDAGRPRGVFCGIGVCFDCLVAVDGRPNQRACLVPVESGAEVRTQEGTGHDG